MWIKKDKKSAGEVASLLPRAQSTVTRHIKNGKLVKNTSMQGRPCTIPVAKLKKVIELMKEMIKKANGEYEVTHEMLRRRARLRCHVQTGTEASQSRGEVASLQGKAAPHQG